MALHRIIVRDDEGNVVSVEFVNSAADRDRRVREHRDAGHQPESATGTMDGFNFVEG